MELQLGRWQYMFDIVCWLIIECCWTDILTFLCCSPELGVYAYSAAQVKKAIEVGGWLIRSCFMYMKYGCMCCVAYPFPRIMFYIPLGAYIGYTLPRWRKLCFLGWTWRLSVSFEHRYGERAQSYGKTIYCFMLYFHALLLHDSNMYIIVPSYIFMIHGLIKYYLCAS